MAREFRQIEWDGLVEEDCRALVRLAVREDLERELDWTAVALAPSDRTGAADIVTRKPGIVAGMQAVAAALDEMGGGVILEQTTTDRSRVAPGARLGQLSGKVRDLLTTERIVLNLLGRLMGIATLADQYVTRVGQSRARVYDTRKTTPGWRRLEKYAVRCGGAYNHRLGLYDAILIKDNHLAQSAEAGQTPGEVAAQAIRRCRQFISELPQAETERREMLLEIEVDSIEQLASVLSESPDIVLLDNMSEQQLRACVALRDATAPGIQLEASGGVTLDTIAGIAATGVDRISVGALTHGATSLDIGLDWHA